MGCHLKGSETSCVRFVHGPLSNRKVNIVWHRERWLFAGFKPQRSVFEEILPFLGIFFQNRQDVSFARRL